MSRLFLKFSLFYPLIDEKSKQGQVHTGYTRDKSNRARGNTFNLALKTVERSYITEERLGIPAVHLLTRKRGSADLLNELSRRISQIVRAVE